MSLPEATLPLAPIRIRSRRPVADQGVVDGHQPVGERKADVVFVLQRRRGGPALGAVDDDEVGRHPFGQHRLADRQHLDPGADAQLEADRFAVGQFTHPRHEHDQFARGVKRRMRRRADTLLADRHAAVAGDLLR